LADTLKRTCVIRSWHPSCTLAVFKRADERMRQCWQELGRRSFGRPGCQDGSGGQLCLRTTDISEESWGPLAELCCEARLCERRAKFLGLGKPRLSRCGCGAYSRRGWTEFLPCVYQSGRRALWPRAYSGCTARLCQPSLTRLPVVPSGHKRA